MSEVAFRVIPSGHASQCSAPVFQNLESGIDAAVHLNAKNDSLSVVNLLSEPQSSLSLARVHGVCSQLSYPVVDADRQSGVTSDSSADSVVDLCAEV